ncbi:MAG: peptidase, partial [Rhodopirellula sp. JB053]
DFADGTPYDTVYGPASDEVEYGIVDTGLFDTSRGADGGDISGIAAFPNNFNTLVATTDAGGIHVFSPFDNVDAPLTSTAAGYQRVIPTDYYGTVTPHPDHFVTTPVFTSVTFGPQAVEGQAYRETLFATTTDGWIYAFTLEEADDGTFYTEPARVFYDGRFAVQLSYTTGASVGRTPVGLAFSNLEVNPLHSTNDRFDDAGHGQEVDYDQSRVGTTGGSSLYFGFEINGGNSKATNTLSRADGDALGELAPGGSHGSVISDPFDLREYSSEDKPSLYFSYHIEVEDNDDYAPNRSQRDSFRVFGAGDDGVWRLLATNDEYRSFPNVDEYDYHTTTDIPVQTVFDDNGENQWRQVRADLSPLAGSSNVRIRFDFSTAGAMQAHFGSVELVGVPGQDLADRDQTVIFGDDGNGVLLENIVGRDVVFPAGSELNDGDAFLIANAAEAAALGSNQVVARFQNTTAPSSISSGSPVTTGTVSVLGMTIPSGSQIVDGQLLEITTPSGVSTVQFVDFGFTGGFAGFGGAGISGTVAFSGDAFESSAADLALAIRDALSLEVDAIVEGNSIGFLEATAISTDIDPSPLNDAIGAPPVDAIVYTATNAASIDTFQSLFFDQGVLGGTSVVFLEQNSAGTLFSEPGVVVYDATDTAADIAAELLVALDGLAVPVSGSPDQIVFLGDGVTTGPEVLISYQPGMTRDQIATGVAGAMPGELLPRTNGLGRVSFLAATDVQVDESIQIGQANPVLVNESLSRLIVPSGDQASTGEVLEIDLDGTLYTLTFVRSTEATLGATDEIVFDSGDTKADVAATILSLLPAGAASINSEGDLVFNDRNVGINVTPSATRLAVDQTGTPQFMLLIPDPADLKTGESVFLSGWGGPGVQLTFVRRGSNVADTGGIQIFFDETDTAEEVSQQIVDKLFDRSPGSQAVLLAAPNPPGIGVDNAFANAFFGGDPAVTFVATDETDTYAIPITFPAGSEITDGETLTIFRKDDPSGFGENYYFTTDAADLSPSAINYQATFTPQEMADAFLTQIDSSLFARQHGTSGREVLVLEASSIDVESGSNLITFEAAVSTTINFYETRAVPVIVNATMDTAEVTESLRQSLAESLGRAELFANSSGSDASLVTSADNYKIYGGDRIRLFDAFVSDPGTFGINQTLLCSTSMPGDEFGVGLPTGFSTGNISTIAASNNQVSGVYIDDIIVGFAERGEEVLYENYFAEGGNSNFVLDPAYTPDTRADSVQPEFPDEILVGGYTLEIRTADEYGVPQDYDPINLLLDEPTSSGRSFDTNDRLVDGAVTIVAPAGVDLLDGDTFVLDDGSSRLTFEFDSRYQPGGATGSGNVPVVFDPADTAAQIAAKIRDAINSQQAQDTLAITAATGDGRDSGVSSSSRVELFGNEYRFDANGERQLISADIFVNPGSGRMLTLDMVAEETFAGNYTSRRISLIDHDAGTVDYVVYSDELAQAAVPGYVNGDTLFVTGKIGDAVDMGITPGTDADDGSIIGTEPTLDIDTIRVYLEAGEGIDIDVDTTGLFRVGEGLQLPFVAIVEQGTRFTFSELNFAFAQQADGSPAISDFTAPTFGFGETQAGANLQFTPVKSGYYDIIVSSTASYSGDAGPISAVDSQAGEYFMSVRPTGDPGVPERDVLLVDYHFGKTDENRVSDQGQLIIEGNFIRDSADVGISSVIGEAGQAFYAEATQFRGYTQSIAEDNSTRPGS